MQDTHVPRPKAEPRDVIEILSSDDEGVHDEDTKFQTELQKAIEASKAVLEPMKSENSKAPVKNEAIPSLASSSSVPHTFPFDRAQLERERLERLKRLRPDLAENPSSSNIKNERLDDEHDRERDVKRQRVSHPSSAINRSDVSSSRAAPRVSAGTSRTRGSEDNIYWSGEIRQTANKHVEKTKDTRPIFTLTDTIAPVSDSYTVSECSSLDIST